MKHPMLACMAGVLLCAAAPAVFLAAVDAAELNREAALPQEDVYTAPTPSGQDYYLLRQLAARTAMRQSSDYSQPGDSAAQGGQKPSFYVAPQSSLVSMQAGFNYEQTVTDLLDQLVQVGVVDEVWIEELNNEHCYDTYTPYDGDGEYYLGQLYYTVDSLGFVTLKYYAARDNALYTLMVLTLDSQTGAPVELWLSADTYDMAVLMAKSGEQRELPQDMPDNEWEYRLAAGTWQPDTPTTDSLRGYIQILGLDSLDDWTEPEDSSYTCALASENGGAVVTASSHRFSDTIYQSYDDSETLDRVYLSVNISAAG